MTNTETTPAYTRRFWAKSEPRHGYPKRIHLLEHHLADVGACFEELLAQPTIRQRLARTSGRDDLDHATVARLSLFAALHDIGKVNVGFQTQIWEQEYRQGNPRINRAGHTLDLTPVLDANKDKETAEWFFDTLGWWWDATEYWDDRGGETVCALFVAALSHHGQPLQLESDRGRYPQIWRDYGNLSPREQVQRIGQLARRWFPDAFTGDALWLPSNPEFQHHFLGLCTLADWIGSNEKWFRFVDQPDDDYMEKTARRKAKEAVESIGLNLSRQRAAFSTMPSGRHFADLFDHPEPNAIQQQAAEKTPLDNQLVIIESETGSGKTEAALWRFAGMHKAGLVDGVYFALPTRAAAAQIYGRVKNFTANLFPEQDRPAVVLAVPGYEPDADADGVVLQDYQVWWDSHHHAEKPWAAESSKRYLAAQIAVGTVDQAMMAALKVRHAHMRAACLSRNLLVVDEVHASDAYMRRILKALLEAHTGAGGYALLMSATLGSVARQEWLSAGLRNDSQVLPMAQAIESPYPAVSVMAAGGESISAAGESQREKTVSITAAPLMQDFDAVAEKALWAAQAGAKVLVIRNTVAHAVQTFQAVEAAARPEDAGLLFTVQGMPALHHSRFAPADRRLLDAAVETRLGKERDIGGAVVIGTQTLEQSLDIDADLLITDLCPVDVLLQRIGRLHRHQRGDRPADYAKPACIALTLPGENLSPLLKSPVNGLGRYVYEDLRILEATLRLIGAYPQWRIPEMNRLLVESATHPDALEDIVEELGDDWKVHGNNVEGGEIAEGLTAANAIIRRNKSFFADNREVLFGSDEERIRTRLGDEGIEVEFNPPPASPFNGAPIQRLTIPEHLLRGATADGPIAPAEVADGFTFAIGDRAFRYDRLGLRRQG